MFKFLNFLLLLLYIYTGWTTALLELEGEASKSIYTHFRDPTAKCTVIKCKVICFNGRSCDIERDVKRVLRFTQIDCSILEELRLYSYDFPNAIISKNFLNGLSNKIKNIYIAASNVIDIEAGAFGDGIFYRIAFENLNLIELRRDFFEKTSRDFQALSIIQNNFPLRAIHRGFLDLVQSRIRTLTIQVGIPNVENITGSSSLLSNLAYLDLSHNDLGNSLDEKTFSMLSMVERLDLSYSKLTSLPKFVFSNFARTLTYLDISHNTIKTISSNIFGWQKRRPELTIQANYNDWFCDCDLKNAIKEVFGPHKSKIYCSSPEEYHNFSVTDDRICEEIEPPKKEPLPGIAAIPNNSPTLAVIDTSNPISTVTSTVRSTSTSITSKTTTTSGITTTVGVKTTTRSFTTTPNPTTTMPTSTSTQNVQIEDAAFDGPPSLEQGYGNKINLVCEKSKNTLILNRAKFDFSIIKRSNLRVDISLKVSKILIEDLGLIWFSKVTKEYYDMEVNYNEYGLGCYSLISYSTTVENLMPNVAYTFCLIEKSKSTVLPFNCKSIHMSSNLSIRKAWVTRDIRCAGISLTVLGIVFCTFIGICISFLILKHKPILLKGSKRVATTKRNGNEIVVLPKDCSQSELRFREQMLAKRSSKSNVSSVRQRRNSTDSDVSYQSYMNTNLYEELPAYIAFDSNKQSYPSISNECNNDYILPLAIEYNPTKSLSYAEIPFRRKRSSNDPLPEIPKAETLKKLTKVASIDITKHNFQLSSGYALAYDCIV